MDKVEASPRRLRDPFLFYSRVSFWSHFGIFY